MIDTLRTAKRLQAAGFTVAQAEAVATVLGVVSRQPADGGRGVSCQTDSFALNTELRDEIGRMNQSLILWWTASQAMVLIAFVALRRFDLTS